MPAPSNPVGDLGNLPKFPPTVTVILTELVKLEAEASRRVGTVSSCDGGLDQLNAVNSEARQALQLLNDKLSELEHIANEQDSEAHRQLLLDRVKRAKIQHQSLQMSLRKANLQMKMQLDQRKVLEREELMKGSSVAEQLKKRSNKQQLMRASREASNSLRGASQVLAQQIKSSLETTKVLAESSQTLKDTKSEMGNFEGVVATARNLITKLGRREFTNNILIMFGLCLFALTCLYILKRRLAWGFNIFGSIWNTLTWIFGGPDF